MSRRLHTRGSYAADGKARRLQVREEAGHRCIRCGHPFETGKHGKGEWTPCDEHCTHGEPTRINGLHTEAQWRILTVHHFDGDKANDAWWNTLALCQRCHLTIQSRVNPDIPFFFEHSEWAKPYIAGFYAWKYKGSMLTREQAAERMDELLAYELAGQRPLAGHDLTDAITTYARHGTGRTPTRSTAAITTRHG